ncbi:MAG: hypothetical protein WCP18_01625 [bacterium]
MPVKKKKNNKLQKSALKPVSPRPLTPISKNPQGGGSIIIGLAVIILIAGLCAMAFYFWNQNLEAPISAGSEFETSTPIVAVPAKIFGSVKEVEVSSSAPLGNISLVLNCLDNPLITTSAKSDQNGNYSFQIDLNQGKNWQLLINTDGYWKYSTTTVLSGDKNLDITMQKIISIFGQARQMGQATTTVAGATIEVWGNLNPAVTSSQPTKLATLLSGDDGSYQIFLKALNDNNNYQPIAYSLIAYKADYTTSTKQILPVPVVNNKDLNFQLLFLGLPVTSSPATSTDIK